ncbi:hypothetical protein [Streptomyces sp. RTd22]|uniref:hypothetical protein n=1 Tax=Streptomyces sp. RTd22 TaxID=1841249 RepID=UPI000ACE7839|nr:hypothetical protein [Streptomyces sp. RTd22]
MADAEADADGDAEADVAGELNVRGLHALATAAVAAASKVRREVGLCTRTPSMSFGGGDWRSYDTLVCRVGRGQWEPVIRFNFVQEQTTSFVKRQRSVAWQAAGLSAP